MSDYVKGWVDGFWACLYTFTGHYDEYAKLRNKMLKAREKGTSDAE